MKLQEADLTVRAFHILKELNIKTTEELMDATIPAIGTKIRNAPLLGMNNLYMTTKAYNEIMEYKNSLK